MVSQLELTGASDALPRRGSPPRSAARSSGEPTDAGSEALVRMNAV